MKKFEVEKIVSKAIIITAILLCLAVGTAVIQNGYFSILTYATTSIATIVVSVLFGVVALTMVVLGIIVHQKYYMYASFSAFVAIFVMLLKINYEIKGLEFSIGATNIKFYMISMACFALAVVATWARAIAKIVRN